MASLVRQRASDCSNPVLDIWFQMAGVAVTPYSLRFQIYNISTAQLRETPAQVYPSISGTYAIVDLVTLCPTAGANRIATGRYVANWTPAAGHPLGRHRIVWYFRMTSTDTERIFIEDFDVVHEDLLNTGTGEYCLLSDIRDEGVTTTQASDERVQMLIRTWSRYIDKITGRWFEPRELTIDVDGYNGRDILLDIPIIAIRAIYSGWDGDVWSVNSQPLDVGDYRVYNRHLTQGLLMPDDRENPKISMVGAMIGFRRLSGANFADGQQNIRVVGTFGYTEGAGPGYANAGGTPDLIRYVCKRLVIRNIHKLGVASTTVTAIQPDRIIRMKTRDQEVEMARLAMHGAFTGDPEIDQVLVQFVRPPILGAV
jgi:hypothetical protein